MTRTLLRLMTVTLTVCAFTSCSYKKELNSLEEVALDIKKVTDVDIQVCKSEGQKTEAVIHIALLVDNSRSNFARLGDQPGTDPDNQRFATIIDFVSSQDPEANIYYSIIPFGSEATRACYQVFENNTKAITKDPQEVIDYINFVVSGDGPVANIPPECNLATNYVAALEALIQVKKEWYSQLALEYPANQIGNDARMAAVSIAAFASDGLPRILVNDEVYEQTQEEILGPVYNFMTTLTDLAGNDVREASSVTEVIHRFDTLFYTKPPISTAPIELLKLMAEEGEGQFIDLATNPSFAAVKMPELINSFSVETPIAVNLNGVWEEKNNVAIFRYDSDQDGLSDLLEDELGSDPFIADTDNDGIRDGIERRLSPDGLPVSSFMIPECLADKDKDEDKDNLYYCEELAFGSDDKRSDMNGDGVADGVQVYFGLNPLIDVASADTDGDGVSNREEMQANLPPNIQNDVIEFNDPETAEQSFTLSDEDEDGCRIMAIKNFRIADEEQPFLVNASLYSRQTSGATFYILRAQEQLQTGINNFIEFEQFDEKYYENGI